MVGNRGITQQWLSHSASMVLIGGEIMENPKCPYCGGLMDENDSDRIRLYKVYWYTCDNCGATSPYAKSAEDAYTAAMKRDRAKGEWITDYCAVNGHSDIYCSVCNKDATYFVGSSDEIHWSEEYPAYCPNCGADMRKEAINERNETHSI